MLVDVIQAKIDARISILEDVMLKKYDEQIMEMKNSITTLMANLNGTSSIKTACSNNRT